MTRTLSFTIAILTAAAALLLANAASATTPTAAQMPGDYSQTFSGADSACGFDITFSAAGTVNVTTYNDNAGLPVRESIHGSLAHTRSLQRARRPYTSTSPPVSQSTRAKSSLSTSQAPASSGSKTAASSSATSVSSPTPD